MKGIVLKVIVLTELILIVFLAFKIYKNLVASHILDIVSEAPIPRDKLDDRKSSELKYYQEFKPAQRIVEQREWLDGKITHTINQDTLNEPRDYSIEKKNNVLRIITLGDSFTFGLLVNTHQNWPEILEQILSSDQSCKNNQFEVINLGMPGYGVEYITNRYLTRGKKYNPDLIVWLESGSGFDRVNELMMPLINKYEKEMTPADMEKSREEGIYTAWLRGLEEFHKLHSEQQIEEMVGHSWRKFFSKKGKIKVVVATFNNLSNEQKKLLNSWSAGSSNVKFYNDIPALNTIGWQLKDGHPSPEGHKMIADHIFKYVTNNNLIICVK